MKRIELVFGFLVGVGSVAGCGAPATPETQALLDVKTFIVGNINDLEKAVGDLQNAAPAPDADGWNSTADKAAVDNMKAAWKRARIAYEHIEGAIAVLFSGLDVSTDARYDDFISTTPDDNLFDDQGATGIHAIERILYSDVIPARVKTFEMGLMYYKPAAFPSNMQEASDFKTKLCARLVTDVKTMQTDFAPLALDPAAAYRGVIGSMNEQVEKANKAITGEEESRYAQFTLADMRTNVDAGLQTYNAFRSWLLSKGGASDDVTIKAGFDKIRAKYDSYAGDSLPPVPATWSPEMPSAEDLATPFGQLFQLLEDESNPDTSGSLVNTMNHSADLLGIPQLPN